MKLNFKSFGQGDPIIILHGLFGTLDNWQTIAKKLAEHYWVFIVDQRNHGRSPHHPALNYKAMADDLKYFMEEHWIHNAHIMGHSMGGKTAMQFAVDFPEMVDKLVVVDIGPFSKKGGHGLIFDALLSMDLDGITTRNEADDLLSKKIPEFGVRQFLLKNLTRNKDGNYSWKMNLPVLHKEYKEILADIKVTEPFEGETLFISGAQSNYIDENEFSSFKDIFPNAQLKTIEKAGHWVHADQPKELLQAVTNFLEE